MSKPLAVKHSEWLSLVDISGPFLTLPVLKRALPMGPDPTPLPLVDDLRVAWAEFGDDHTLAPRWIRWVLGQLLELPDEVLKEGTDIGPALTYTVPEHGVRLRPDFIVVDPDSTEMAAQARLLITVLPPGATLDQRLDESTWSADAVERMAELCRGTKVRVGLVTNGDEWAIVDAPIGGATGVATWDASLWLDERLTLDAFTTLLGVRRFFSVDAADTLEAMLAESANAEAEVTDQLGRQVRAAVELLVDAMSRANRDQHGQIFADLSGVEVYEAAVTVMMRLVFLLSAEERGLFLLGDETYDATYAVCTLRAQLEEEADTYGEEVIARRTDAWHRLLATFRMVYAGAEHENLRLPAYGGSLFDPDRFPFLEGRSSEEPWQTAPSHPIPIDNRTILHILGALQILRFRDRGGVTEARRLSFRALDVEQIGHVYEGLLDHSAVNVDEPAVGLAGKLEPELALELIEEAAEQGEEHLVDFLCNETGLSQKAVTKALAAEPEAHQLELLTSACDNDAELANRIAPYLGLLREDLAGLPMVFLPNSMYVTQSSDRRSSGTYYTPRVLAEEMVLHTLEPLVYSPGPAEGAEPADWKLRPSRELLDLKICDMAMGSGAFLVATCRYLSSRLLEAWEIEGLGAGDRIPLPGDGSTVMPIEESDREILAKRLVADSCLYGVDRNPMAVEMAKLSMWLVTLAKDQPFTFVDHALRCGDSLLGITDLRQLDSFHLDPAQGRRLHGGSLFDPSVHIQPLINSALGCRRHLESFPVIDVHDAQLKRELLDQSDRLLDTLKVVADLVVGAAMSAYTKGNSNYDSHLAGAADDLIAALSVPAPHDDPSRLERLQELRLTAGYWLDEGRPPLAPDRRCLHWPLEFPEVFVTGVRAGFDAVIGNPPFVGDAKLLDAIGRNARELVVEYVASGKRGRADLVTFFLLRSCALLRDPGCAGLIATDTVAQGDSREVGIQGILANADLQLVRAEKSRPWPGTSSVDVSLVWFWRGDWSGSHVLESRIVEGIDSYLTAGEGDSLPPDRLLRNQGLGFLGSKIDGIGFLLTPAEAETLLTREPQSADIVFPFLNGEDLNSSPTLTARRFVIDFAERSLSEAERYPQALEIVRREVKPARDNLKRKAYRERWWRFAERGVNLYRAIEARGLTEVIVVARVSKHVRFCRVPTAQVFSEKVVVVASDSWPLFALLSSEIHRAWVQRFSSTRGIAVNYTPTDCLQTFPIQAEVESSKVLQDLGRRLWSACTGAMNLHAIGITALFNLVNDSAVDRPEVAEIRELQSAIDAAVLDLYGWSDLDPGFGFFPSRQGDRYSLAAETAAVVLDRLVALNREFASTEQRTGVPSARDERPRSIVRQRHQTQLALGDA